MRRGSNVTDVVSTQAPTQRVVTRSASVRSSQELSFNRQIDNDRDYAVSVLLFDRGVCSSGQNCHLVVGSEVCESPFSGDLYSKWWVPIPGGCRACHCVRLSPSRYHNKLFRTLCPRECIILLQLGKRFFFPIERIFTGEPGQRTTRIVHVFVGLVWVDSAQVAATIVGKLIV